MQFNTLVQNLHFVCESTGLALPDMDDRHVLAAAIRCSAQAIVTENHKDFPVDVIEEHGAETLSADDICRVLAGFDQEWPFKARFGRESGC